jgi:hypothetical protein
VDSEVQRLERLLAPLRHVPDPQHVDPHPRRAAAAPRTRSWLRLALLAAAVVLALGGVWWFTREARVPGGSGGSGGVVPSSDAPVLVARGESRPLSERTWVETHAEARELRLGDVGQFTLGAGSRLEVQRLAADETRFYLERGRLEAFVSADAHPRFFQVGTPAARCVDLGCQYTLVVDAAGDAEVEVATGRVAFENEGREVFVPRGARCRATRASGAGTPRFLDARPELVAALDRFDAAREAPAPERRTHAGSLLALAANPRDGLAVWHLLQDADVDIAQRAHARLHEVAGTVPAAVSPPDVAPNADDRQAWRTVLEPHWW